MKHFCCALMMVGMAHGAVIDEFIASAAKSHGTEGEKAATFLVKHIPEKDRQSLSHKFLTENLDLAFQARAQFPWAKSVPEEIFLNDVLPYAVFDESRDPWRADFMEKAKGIVKDLKTSGEAAQALNREFFKLVNVHYNTQRKAPNQSPKESMESGHATCTGLSIILVDACRAIGIPARAVGTPMWANNRGNHTWVEIWDGDWHFMGADEYDEKGLDHGWFVKDAAQATAGDPLHAVYATSWKSDGLKFPLVWAPQSGAVKAVNVTARYAKSDHATEEVLSLGVRLLDKIHGNRMVADLRAIDETTGLSTTATTKAGTADLNDMPRLKFKSGAKGTLSFTMENETREMSFGPLKSGESTIDAVWSDLRPARPQ